MAVYALVDCNNFYVSCERIFNPSLEKKPVVVLSNNDGCIVARSNEVKMLKVPMGAPFYKYQAFLKAHNVVVLSSNYTLYGDLSQRVVATLRSLCPMVEVYSIDESFLLLDGLEHLNLMEYAAKIRQTICQWIGLPVCVGIAPTKTLAKLANHYAKKHILSGICDLREVSLRNKILSECTVEKVWGIGRQLTEKFKKLSIHTAKDLCDSNPKQMRKQFGVTVERTILELNGISCFGSQAVQPRKNIIASRSFGKKVTDLSELEEAISNHVARACIRLREQKSRAQGLSIFIATSPFNTPFYQNSKTQGFAYPTADTCTLITIAKHLIKSIFRPNLRYQKAGVILLNTVSETFKQDDLFDNAQSISIRRDKLMQVWDEINTRMGSNMLFSAAQGIERRWEMRSDNRSARYTTHWEELPCAVAKGKL